MDVLSVILEIHLVVAFLLALCALIFSWEPRGLRVVSAVAGLQFLLGLIIAGLFGAGHRTMPSALWLHILLALLILGAYGVAMRFSKRAGGRGLALGLAVLGIVLIFTNIYLGMHMYGRM